ncbi:hypothetical protein WAX74_03055 [Psychrobacillus sp. FJAT-51614]|uniref:SbsC C-terminal domain-containing protein n=1 Tax=Psychrobacillus mangrovi TaxID=3117745 RepID=A0ABU8F0V5_9BACI
MKKLLFIVLAVVIIGTSLQLPLANAEAASISRVESFLKTAEQHAGALKWQSSYEITKEIKYPDMTVFNLTKNAYWKAYFEIEKLSENDKAKFEKRLHENVGIHLSRTTSYIDAITSGNKIANLTNQYNTLYASTPTSNMTVQKYHDLSTEIRKQAQILYHVYGKSTREAILAKYKKPGEKALLASKYVISSKIHLNYLDSLIANKATQSKVEANVAKFFDMQDMIKNEEIAADLYTTYYEIIRKDSNFLAQEKEIIEFFKKSTEYTNTEDVESLLGLYSQDFPDYLFLKNDMETTFKDFDLRYETLGIETHFVIDGMALVSHNEVETEQNESFEYNLTYLLEKDATGNWQFLDLIEFE